ncbi:hypothetical protein OAK47_01710 [Planctomycetaceae bacterium]|jgi:hypothetical protein|nr:hypothetical protein [Planctomycetaceae bacterium]MDG2391811.1 hypothetical protein [Planctomycetaceae bacterium]
MTFPVRLGLFCSLSVCLLVGCPSPPPSSGTGGSSGTSSTAEEQRCADSLKNAFNSLDPHRLEIDADLEATANELNNWLSTCGQSQWDDEKALKKLSKLLSDEQMATIQAERFGSRDVAHVRTSILLRQIAEQAAEDADSDLERAVSLFRYVTRTIIQQPDNQNIPLTLYQVFLFGRATAEHQAWAFTELLHQLRIDSVVLTPQQPGDKKWIVAVCLEDGNYLFDFSLLTPVPSKSSTTWPIDTPATLDEVINSPELLTTLQDLGSQVPSAKELTTPDVLVPYSAAFWSMRMRSLNKTQSGLAAVLADPLLDGEYGMGAISRIAKSAESWDPAKLALWEFPEEQENQYWSIRKNSSQQQALIARMMPFLAPLEVQVNKEKQEVNVTKEGKKQWATRLTQLQGDFPKAITTYGGLRIGSKNTRNLMAAQGFDQSFEVILQREDSAAEDAHFWVAASQYDLGEWTDARSTYQDYLNRYEAARWTDAVHLMMAQIAMTEDDFESARSHLSGILKTSSLKKAAMFLESQISESSTVEPNNTDEPKVPQDGTEKEPSPATDSNAAKPSDS